MGKAVSEAFEYVIKYKGKLNQPEQYENIILKANTDGSTIQLKDVARIEFGSFTYSGDTRVNGKPSVGIAINQTAGSNANDIQVAILAIMDKAAGAFPKGINSPSVIAPKRSSTNPSTR